MKPVDFVIAGCLAAAAGCGFAAYMLAYQPLYSSEVRVIQWHNEAGEQVSVSVSNDPCPQYPTRGCAYLFGSLAAIFLGRNDRRLPHELGHVAGMKHTPWQKNGHVECATVTAAGWQTAYQVGDLICGGMDGSDYIDRRTTVAEVK